MEKLNSLIEDLKKDGIVKNNSKIQLISNNTNSNVYLIDSKYIIKNSYKNLIKDEKFFLDFYKSFEIYEKIICYKNGDFIIYEYIDGNVEHKLEKDINSYIYDICKIIRTYKRIDIDGYGYIYNLKKTWKEFLNSEILKRQEDMNDEIKTKEVVKAINQLDDENFNKKLLHGDLGFYNILYKDKKIKRSDRS